MLLQWWFNGYGFDLTFFFFFFFGRMINYSLGIISLGKSIVLQASIAGGVEMATILEKMWTTFE